MEEEKTFKDYKEKQKYYRNKTKEVRYAWVSKMPNNLRHQDGKPIEEIVKGRTYVKPKEDKDEKKKN